jgi:hypothetical protein
MSNIIMGLDLGQAQNFSAVAILESGDGLVLRYLERFAQGTSYPDIVRAVVRLSQKPPLLGQAPLVVDQTGVGRPVVDMLRQAEGIGQVVPVTISAGQAVTERDDGSFSVPKKELVTSLQVAFQSQRLKIPRRMRHADALVHELLNFKVKITASANEVFGTWRQGQHDDLVLAVALACWYAPRCFTWTVDPIKPGQRTLMASAPEGVFMTPWDGSNSFPDSW